MARKCPIYRGLAAEASRSNFDDVAEALELVLAIIRQCNSIQSDGAIYMSEDETAFDTLITEFSQNIHRSPKRRSSRFRVRAQWEIERKLTDVLASVAHLNPLGGSLSRAA